MNNLKFNIAWNQPSTLRGIVWAVAGLISLICIIAGDLTKAAAITGLAGTVAGGLGVALDDKSHNP